MPGSDEDAPQLLVHAEEHLELVAVLGYFELVDEPQGVPDQELVVRRYADVHAAPQELVQEEDVVLPDGVEVLVRYLSRLVVDALAQPYRDACLRQSHHVAQRLR